MRVSLTSEGEIIPAKDVASYLRNLGSEIAGCVLSSGQFIRLDEAQNQAVIACRGIGMREHAVRGRIRPPVFNPRQTFRARSRNKH